MADRLLFPPTTVADMRQRGWDAPDFVYVSGDAYVDHPSFGAAVIVRTLEAAGSDDDEPGDNDGSAAIPEGTANPANPANPADAAEK